MKTTLFIIAFLGVFVLINMYISRRYIQHLHLDSKQKRWFRYFLYFNYAGIVLYMLGRYSGEFPNWLFFFVSLPIGILFLLFCTAIFYDISRVLLKAAPIAPKRREFFKKTLDISSFGLAFALSAKAVYEARFVKLEKVNIKIKNLGQSYKIVQISDIHIGGLIDAKFIASLVQRINLLQADIVVITGDLVDIKLSQAMPALAELQKLNSKYGSYFIVGNHEYFHDIDAIISAVKSLGIRVLENETVYIGEATQGFNLVGVYDIFGYRVLHHLPELEKALLGKDDRSPTILLAHQPRFIEEVTSGVDLMLSGHTHGGQLYPFRFIVKLQQPYIDGLHQHNDALQIYINKGTGFWGPPMRLGASSEITEITLETK
ncbi:MAG: metallophosphoesterase [Sulfurimonas sp.]|nr:metallophosphoesterase [Sulfurimonas sp.]